jgi:ParB/RepB/Spo0J family partition protein
MAELRNVDPRILQANPDNPRRIPVSPAMDEQLLASIKAIGIIQPPIVVEKDGALVINAGDRRVKQAIRADFATIDVLVCDADEARDLIRSLAENLIRASMNSVDIWRGIDTLEKKGWNEQAIADALALPLRTVKRLKLLAHLHPPMLDAIAAGSAPTEDQLRTIAAASHDEQAQVWKKHKPKKGHDASWYEIARALAKRRIPFSAAKFGDDLAQAYGVVWEDDLFAPADEDGRYTTQCRRFLRRAAGVAAEQPPRARDAADRGQLDFADALDVADDVAQMLFEVVARVDREGRVVDRGPVGDHDQDAALFGALAQPVVRPQERLAVGVLLEDALAQHQPETAPGAPPGCVGGFVDDVAQIVEPPRVRRLAGGDPSARAPARPSRRGS